MTWKLPGLIFLLFLLSCSERPVVIYCDPHLQPLCLALMEQSEREYELKVKSSEVLRQHLDYGQPVDILFGAEPDLFPADLLKQSYSIADARIVRVKRPLSPIGKKLGNDSCLLLPATGTPMRTAAEQVWPELGKEFDCSIYADFYDLHLHYLRHGWIEETVAWESMINDLDEKQVLEKGPVLKGHFFMALPLSSGHEEAGEVFDEFKEMMTDSLLGGFHFIH